MSDTDAALATPAPGRQRQTALSVPPLTACLIAGLGFAIFVLAQVPHAGNVLNLILPDHDDAIRLLGVRDLLAGQSWFDTHQYRYLPPDGVLMHWSRLADAPLAAGIWLLTPLLGQRAAEGFVALAWPPILFLAYLVIVVAAMRRMAPGLAAVVAVLVAGQMVVFQYIFRVGRIDHHGLQVVLITTAVLFFAFHGRLRHAPELSGLFAGLSLAIGLETLPLVAIIGAANVLAWVLDPDDAAGSMPRFGVALALASLVAFGVQTAPQLWTTPACDMLSPPWLLLTVGGAAITIALALAGPSLPTAPRRLAAAGAAGVALIACFALVFPNCLAGPYEMVPQPYRAIWLGDILEARPGLLRLAEGSNTVFQAFGPLLAAAIAAIVLAVRSTGAMQRLMVICAGCLGVGVVLSLAQVRGLYVVSAFIPPVAGIAIWRIVEALRDGRRFGFRAAAMALAVLAFIGPIWAAPALAVRQFAPVLKPAGHPPSDCLLKENISVLDRLPQGVILSPIDLGAYTLLYTRHAIVAAGFHRAVEGIIAGIDAFKGSEADMQRIVRQHAPDYVVICSDWAKADADDQAPFAKALAEGASVPWLEPVPLDAGGLMVWRVRNEHEQPQ